MEMLFVTRKFIENTGLVFAGEASGGLGMRLLECHFLQLCYLVTTKYNYVYKYMYVSVLFFSAQEIAVAALTP